jgi:hypothetical protein
LHSLGYIFVKFSSIIPVNFGHFKSWLWCSFGWNSQKLQQYNKVINKLFSSSIWNMMICDPWRIPVHWHTLSYPSMVSFLFLFFQGRIIIRNFLCGMDHNYLRKKWAYWLFSIIRKNWKSDYHFNMRSFSLS